MSLNKNYREEIIVNIMVLAFAMVAVAAFIIAFTEPAFADVGENVGSWLMEQAFWIAVGICAVVAISFLVKRAWVPFGVFFVIAAILLYIIQDPSKLTGVGEKIFTIVGL